MYTVSQGPYRSGRSRHGAPVRRTHKMPLSISRGSRRGRPVSAGFTVTKGAISTHCSSDSSCRCAMVRSPSSYGGYRHQGWFPNRA
jgi:hypothetical protein